MFFGLSKLLWFLLKPSTLMIAALAWGLWHAHRGRLLAARRWLVGGLAALLIIGLSPLSDLFCSPLETRFPRAALGGRTIAGIIVLGGAEDGRSISTRELMALGEAGERLTETVALARRLPTARVVFSGGSDEILRHKPPEAQTAGRLLAALGVEPQRMTLEDKSRNTSENARFSKALVDPKPGERWLLVTSAWHMPRAIGCFRAAGFDIEAWPVDYRSPEEFDPLWFQGSVPEGLRFFDFIFKEYLGLIAYRVTGRINTLLPGP